MRIRPEQFGAIVATERPPALLYVNRAMARRLGVRASPMWSRDESAHLSAPTELHLSITNRCPVGCRHCFVGAGPRLPGELTDDRVRGVLEAAARAGVFHIAFGGGEPFAHPGLIGFARFTRELGMVPNVTTSGHCMTPALARESRVFGQINVSIDGIGDRYRAARGIDGFAAADRALRMLIRAGARAGINCVVSRENIDHIPEVLRYASRTRARGVLLLRWKPAGRGLGAHRERMPTPEQHMRLLRKLRREILLRRMSIRLDCSFVPLLCAAGIGRRVLKALAINGCEGGLTLAAVWPDGGVSACSFARPACYPPESMESHWAGAGHFERFRRWPERAPEPCRSCGYLPDCRGGCHVVAEAVLGDFGAPDPGCPIVARRDSKLARDVSPT